jgi:hypothetical protein
VLLDLEGLPSSIKVRRPFYIESRTSKPACILYRRNLQCWNAPVYRSPSHADAEELLNYLRHDPWNDSCFIGEPEPLGTWVTNQEGDIILGSGSELWQALSYACDLSSRYHEVIYYVEDVSKRTHKVYTVRRGRVELEADND